MKVTTKKIVLCGQLLLTSSLYSLSIIGYPLFLISGIVFSSSILYYASKDRKRYKQLVSEIRNNKSHQSFEDELSIYGSPNCRNNRESSKFRYNRDK